MGPLAKMCNDDSALRLYRTEVIHSIPPATTQKRQSLKWFDSVQGKIVASEHEIMVTFPMSLLCKCHSCYSIKLGVGGWPKWRPGEDLVEETHLRRAL